MCRQPIFLCLSLLLALTGCASYTAPGGPADMGRLGARTLERQLQQNQQTRGDGIVEAFAREPLADFPASIAVVRVQAPGYRSYNTTGYGSGAFSVVTVRDLEFEQNPLQKLVDEPLIAGIAPLNRLLVPNKLESDEDLRLAAAQVQADMLLIYTFDTAFVSNEQAKPIAVITLGLSPTKKVRVTSTASAVLLDTRNGYVYGLAEATADDDQIASAWTDEAAVDQTRRRVETDAFQKLVGELETMWQGVAAQYAPNAGGVGASTERTGG